MKPAAIIPAVLFLALSLFVPAGFGEIIRLKNGVELHGEVTAFDPEIGVTVKRFDNGGVVHLRWGHILDADVKALRRDRGYTDEEAKPILIRAKKLWLSSGDYFVGIQVESPQPGMIAVKRLGKVYTFRQPQVRNMETIEVEKQEIFTLDELYQEKVAEGLPETALDHYNLAIYCESVTDYARALEHLQQTAELDSQFKPDVISRKIEQMDVKIREKDATELLNEIRNRIYKKRFEAAFALCDKFVEENPDSGQMTELEKLKALAMIKRHDHYQNRILTDYFSYTDRIAYKVAGDKELKLEDALAYARDEMGSDIRKKLAEVFKMEIAEVDELWLNRKGGRSHNATYGTATFILAEDAKRVPETETEEEETKKEEPTTLDENLKKRIEKIKKEREKRAKKRRSRLRIDDIGQSPEQWWKNANVGSRKQLLIAYYAEYSGDMKIVRVKFQNCSTCSGKGWFEYFSSNEEEQNKEPCTICKTLAIVRIVVFK